MSEDKTARAAEIERAIKKADSENDVGQKLDKLLSCMDSLTKRMDAFEGGQKKPGEIEENGELPGTPEKLAADSDELEKESVMADIQARADDFANNFGEQAPKPLSGESPMGYRLRLLKRYQKYSPEFKGADLNSVKDAQVFAGIESRIYADALAQSNNPMVAEGYLRPVKRRDDTGRVTTSFYGHPSVWMSQFGGSRMVVKAFNRDSGN